MLTRKHVIGIGVALAITGSLIIGMQYQIGIYTNRILNDNKVCSFLSNTIRLKIETKFILKNTILNSIRKRDQYKEANILTQYFIEEGAIRAIDKCTSDDL